MAMVHHSETLNFPESSEWLSLGDLHLYAEESVFNVCNSI